MNLAVRDILFEKGRFKWRQEQNMFPDGGSSREEEVPEQRCGYEHAPYSSEEHRGGQRTHRHEEKDRSVREGMDARFWIIYGAEGHGWDLGLDFEWCKVPWRSLRRGMMRYNLCFIGNVLEVGGKYVSSRQALKQKNKAGNNNHYKSYKKPL